MKTCLLVIVGITALLAYPILYPGDGGGWVSPAQIYAALAYYPAFIICSIGMIVSIMDIIFRRRLSAYSITLFALSLVFPLALMDREWKRTGPHLYGKSRAKSDVTQMSRALATYKTAYGKYPSGNEIKIIKALQGNNPNKILFIELKSKYFDQEGRFLDPWGIPYHITILDSDEKPRVWSSGNNKKDESGTADSDDISNWN